MSRNVEIKAQISSVDGLAPLAAALADEGPTRIHQDDTFFNCPNGRLKLRILAADRGQLVFYQRPDAPGPKESFYIVSETAEPYTLLEALTLAYGATDHVVKDRTLFMVGQTRVHLDRVEGLGDYLELEVVLSENDLFEDGVSIANDILAKLQIAPDQLVTGAYADLLRRDRVCS